MTYANHKPTKPGAYWLKLDGWERPVQIDEDADGRLLVWQPGIDFPTRLADLPGEWAGPIPEPKGEAVVKDYLTTDKAQTCGEHIPCSCCGATPTAPIDGMAGVWCLSCACSIAEERGEECERLRVADHSGDANKKAPTCGEAVVKDSLTADNAPTCGECEWRDETGDCQGCNEFIPADFEACAEFKRVAR